MAGRRSEGVQRHSTIVSLLLGLGLALALVAAPRSASALDAFSVSAPTVDAAAHVRVSQRKATGFLVTAMGTLPVLMGMLMEADDTQEPGSPLVATGMAMQATGAAMQMPWEQPRPNTLAGRSRPTVRVLVAYKQGGVKIGLSGRF
mgnify:CR=1 FL=1